MADGSEKIIRWLREEGIAPRPVSDPKCDFSYALDRLFGTLITVAIAKPKNGNSVILQTQYLIPHQTNTLRFDNESMSKLKMELIRFDISDFKIVENNDLPNKINLIYYIYPEDVTRQFLFDALRKLKRVYYFLDVFFDS